MASPQIENGYTTIANEILDHLYKQPLNGTELKVVMCILRYTFGFRRKSHKLSASFMSLCIEWLFLYVRDDPRYSPPQQKSWYTKCTEEYPEITAMLESEQRFEIIGTLRRMPQNFLFKGLPDDIKDDYKLMDF